MTPTETLLQEIVDLLKASRPAKENMDPIEAAAYLTFSPSYLWDLKGKYLIPFAKEGKRIIFRKKDLDQFLADRVVRGADDERRLLDGRRVHLAVKS